MPIGARAADSLKVRPRSASLAALNARYGLRKTSAVFAPLGASAMRRAFERVFKLQFDANADVPQIAQA
jgi:hypothetical protein